MGKWSFIHLRMKLNYRYQQKCSRQLPEIKRNNIFFFEKLPSVLKPNFPHCLYSKQFMQQPLKISGFTKQWAVTVYNLQYTVSYTRFLLWYTIRYFEYLFRYSRSSERIDPNFLFKMQYIQRRSGYVICGFANDLHSRRFFSIWTSCEASAR